MKSAEDRLCSDLAEPLNGTMEWRILTEGEMRPDVIIIRDIGCEDPAQMALTEHDNVIEAFSTDRADQPLGMPILPR